MVITFNSRANSRHRDLLLSSSFFLPVSLFFPSFFILLQIRPPDPLVRACFSLFQSKLAKSVRSFRYFLLHFLAFLYLLTLFRSSILEPDLHLSFRETEISGELRFASNRDVTVKMELLFEFQSLMIGVDHSVLVFRPRLAWIRLTLVGRFLHPLVRAPDLPRSRRRRIVLFVIVRTYGVVVIVVIYRWRRGRTGATEFATADGDGWTQRAVPRGNSDGR